MLKAARAACRLVGDDTVRLLLTTYSIIDPDSLVQLLKFRASGIEELSVIQSVQGGVEHKEECGGVCPSVWGSITLRIRHLDPCDLCG